MVTDGVVKSSCDICSCRCGVLAHLTGGKVIKIEGDLDSPINRGALCAKGLASLEYLYHPDRLKHPLKRIGERGDGKWQQISWDEALDIISSKLIKTRDSYGAEAVCLAQGAHKPLGAHWLVRLANIFGTPNTPGAGHVCFVPRRDASIITCGFDPLPDYEFPPACLVIWGSDVSETRPFEWDRTIQALNRGTKLIVIDPRKTELATKADFWLQLRPGSDLALALAMINIIINEDLFDKAFVDSWTVGFDELKADVQNYPPDKMKEITWVDAETIRDAARFYAINKPACVQWGNAIEHNTNSFQTARAISILRAITGNLGIPGGEMHYSSTAKLDPLGLRLVDKLAMEKRKARVGADLMQMPLFQDALPQSVIRAILEEDPYPIRVAYIQGANPLLTYSNATETYKALRKLDFLVVADMFMTPTAGLADIVLPVASYLEFDSIATTPYSPVVQVQQRVAQIGECRSDYQILSELAKRLGLGEYFWDSEEQCLDAILKLAGLTFEEFRKVGAILAIKHYRSYELSGFETPSRKVEIYSSQLRQWGLDPLPTYHEPPETPYSTPELTKEYPLILTSRKSAYYRHSGGRQISVLRGSHPEPIINIHAETAGKLGIEEGDWVYIETRRGRIKQKANLSITIDPRVVFVDYGWWFPEKGASDLYGWAESNINILTDDKPPYNPEMGSTNLRGILCNVYKCEDMTT